MAETLADHQVINPDLEERLLSGEQGPYTVDDYMVLPEDGPRFQLMRGWLVREPSPREIHQRIVGNLHVLLRRWVDTRQLGAVYLAPFDTVLSRHSVIQPDLLFIAATHRSRITEANVQGPPDLVIEVLSPSTSKRDRKVKLALLVEAGAREAWIVHPDEGWVEVLDLQADGTSVVRLQDTDSIVSPVLGELDFPVEDIFKGY